MARTKAVKEVKRDDWQPLEEIALTDGTRAVKWTNILTGEEATLREGKHPFDNPNAVESRSVFPVAHVVTGTADEADDSEDETSTDRVAALLSKAAGKERAVLKVKRFQEDGTLAWCADMTPEQFESTGYEGIRRDFGAGKYEITLYATNPGTRKFSRYGYEVITLLPIAKKEEPAAAASVVAPIVPLLEKLAERIEKIEAKPAIDPTQQMQTMLAMMVQMREAFGLNQPAQKQQTTSEVLKEIMGFFDVAKQIREEIEPTPPDTSLAGVGLEALKVIGQIVGQKQDSGNPIPSVAIPPQLSIEQAALAAASQNQQPSAQGDNVKENSPEMAVFQEAITGLNAFARFNADPQMVAEMIFEKAPDEVLDLLVKNADWFEQIRAFAPSVAPFEAWYRKVHSALLEIWREENSPPEQPAAA